MPPNHKSVPNNVPNPIYIPNNIHDIIPIAAIIFITIDGDLAPILPNANPITPAIINNMGNKKISAKYKGESSLAVETLGGQVQLKI